MNLFDTYGHLTQEVLRAWAEGSLYEEQRLLVAEHLAVCDTCLLRMTELDEADVPALTPALPEKDLVSLAVHRARSRRRLEVAKRCGIVAAAAAFAFGFTRLDFTQMAPVEPEQTALQPDALQQMTMQLSDGIFDWSIKFSAAVQDTLTVELETELTQRSDDHE